MVQRRSSTRLRRGALGREGGCRRREDQPDIDSQDHDRAERVVGVADTAGDAEVGDGEDRSS